MKRILVFSLLLTSVASCFIGPSEEASPAINCTYSCDDEFTTQQLNEIPARVIKYQVSPEAPATYILSTNREVETWIESNEFILVPCELPEKYQEHLVEVIVSGNKKSCCDLLNNPVAWGNFGCKFELTSISLAE